MHRIIDDDIDAADLTEQAKDIVQINFEEIHTDPFGVQIQQVKVEIDEELLKQIAEQTGGRYFRATDNTKMLEIYSEINRMETTRTIVDSFPVYKELFMKYALIALIALGLELFLRIFVIRRIP